MKQVLQNMRTGKTTVEEVPVPALRPGTALVHTAASLVSAGTERMVLGFAGKSMLGKARSRPDLVRQVLDKARREGLLTAIDAAFNRLDQPMALGYSSAGTIFALGKGLTGFKVGQRVACAGGGYAVHAEYAVVPRNLLAPLSSEVDFESAAFATLGAIALHGFRLAETQVGERVAVIGLGLLGLLTLQIAAAAGCRVLGIDINPARVALGARFGVQTCLREQALEAAQAFSANRGTDVVLICADTPSADPVELAGAIARDRARVVAIGAVGLNIPRNIYYEKELTFVNSRSYGPGRYDLAYEESGHDYPVGYVRWTEGRNLEAVVDLLSSGKLDVKPLITHRFPVDEASQAYAIITGKRAEPFLGILLTFGGAKPEMQDAKVIFDSYAASTTAHIRLGVLGAGSFANNVMLPMIKKVKSVDLVGIASAGGLHAQHAAKKYGFLYATSNHDDIINDLNINTVAILTRHAAHADLVVKALKAGKHVFVEKPLAITTEQLSTIVKQLQITDHNLLITGFNRRFAPLSKTMHEFFISRIEPIYMHYRVNAGSIPLNHWVHDPQQGGGRIIGEGCHFVDFLTFLVGSPPVRASAHGLPDDGKYREDNVTMTFTFQDGSVGVMDYLANGDRSFPKERLEVFCGGRVAVLDDFRNLKMVHGGKCRVVKAPFRQDKGHFNEWLTFNRAIREGGQPPIPYEQLIGVTKATFAAVESLRTGKAVSIA